MNRYKGGGHLKEDVKRWNLYDLVLHHERLTASYVGRAVEKLKALIRERRHCSDYVTEKINEETAKLINYQVVDVETNSCHEDGSLVGTTFRIKKKTGDDKPTHSTFLPDDQSCHPFCSCRRYKTFLQVNRLRSSFFASSFETNVEVGDWPLETVWCVVESSLVGNHVRGRRNR